MLRDSMINAISTNCGRRKALIAKLTLRDSNEAAVSRSLHVPSFFLSSLFNRDLAFGLPLNELRGKLATGWSSRTLVSSNSMRRFSLANLLTLVTVAGFSKMVRVMA